jgi:hypothetical protein
MVCFQTKNPNLGKLFGALAMEYLGTFYDHLVYFKAIANILWPFWHILWPFGIFLPILVFCTKKNLATLIQSLVPINVWPMYSAASP